MGERKRLDPVGIVSEFTKNLGGVFPVCGRWPTDSGTVLVHEHRIADSFHPPECGMIDIDYEISRFYVRIFEDLSIIVDG